jgi:hypothetical protein
LTYITKLCTFTKQSQTLKKKIMTTSNTNTTASKISDNTKANLIAFGIMAVLVIAGIFYGMQLDAIGY